MTTIIAKGKLYGDTITVTVQDFQVLYNGEKNDLLDIHMNSCIEHEPPMGGTYFPSKDEMLCYYNVLSNNFFDKLISIDVQGELETMPYEKDVIY